MKEESHFLERFFTVLRRKKESGVGVAFIVLFIVFSFISKGWLTLSSLNSIFSASAELGIVAVGVSFLMISGEFDLSVGAVFAITPLCMLLLANIGLDPIIAFFIALVVAIFIGYCNGIITLKTSIPSFLTTLGMMMIGRGILLAVSQGFPIVYEGNNPNFAFIVAMNKVFIGGFRTSILWFVIISLIFTIILEKTKYGNWVFAVGGNKKIAKELGVNPDGVKLINFMLSALLAGFAGCVTYSRFRIVSPALGEGLELEAIASAAIGGVLLSGGYGSTVGASMGAFLLGMINCGLIQAGAPSFWYQAFVGAILIIAVIMNMIVRRLER